MDKKIDVLKYEKQYCKTITKLMSMYTGRQSAANAAMNNGRSVAMHNSRTTLSDVV